MFKISKGSYKNIFTITICIVIVIILAYTLHSYTRYMRYPKIVWIFWDSETLPKIIQNIKEYNRDKLKGWDLRFLNLQTVKKYIPDTAYPNNYDDLVPANKSDWMRLYLLNKYGGCWLDAGIILNDPRILNSIYNQSVETSSDLTVFKTSSQNFRHISGVELPLLIDSWFILAPTGSHLVKAWLDEITYAIELGLLEYKRQVIEDGTDLSKIYFKSETDTYLTVHICIQHVLQKKLQSIPRMLILNSKDSMFKIQDKCKWDDTCIADKLNNDPDSKKLPYIKLISKNRTMNLDKFFTGN